MKKPLAGKWFVKLTIAIAIIGAVYLMGRAFIAGYEKARQIKLKTNDEQINRDY